MLNIFMRPPCQAGRPRKHVLRLSWSSVTKLVKTIFWKQITGFRCKLA